MIISVGIAHKQIWKGLGLDYHPLSPRDQTRSEEAGRGWGEVPHARSPGSAKASVSVPVPVADKQGRVRSSAPSGVTELGSANKKHGQYQPGEAAAPRCSR